MNFAEQNLTGKASIDKPWLNFYPEEFRNLDIPRNYYGIIFKDEKSG